MQQLTINLLNNFLHFFQAALAVDGNFELEGLWTDRERKKRQGSGLGEDRHAGRKRNETKSQRAQRNDMVMHGMRVKVKCLSWEELI